MPRMTGTDRHKIPQRSKSGAPHCSHSVTMKARILAPCRTQKVDPDFGMLEFEAVGHAATTAHRLERAHDAPTRKSFRRTRLESAVRLYELNRWPTLV